MLLLLLPPRRKDTHKLGSKPPAFVFFTQNIGEVRQDLFCFVLLFAELGMSGTGALIDTQPVCQILDAVARPPQKRVSGKHYYLVALGEGKGSGR